MNANTQLKSIAGPRWARVALARGEQLVGRTGLLGIALLTLSAAWIGWAWNAHQRAMTQVSAADAVAPAVDRSSPDAPRLALPSAKDAALLLTLVQQTVTAQGLAWSAAEYKRTAATDSAPAALEVQVTLKGTYPQLRAALAGWLEGVPGLALRSLRMSRATSETAEVEAQLALAVYLSDELAAAPTQERP